MFDRLFDFISSIWQSLVPFTVVEPWEDGIILRLGKIHRKLKKGLNWTIPFVETIHTIDTQVRTNWTPPQTMTTVDNALVTVQFVIVWDVEDAEKAITVADDITDAVKDVYIGTCGEMVSQASLLDLNARRFILKLKRECQKRAERYGIRILDVNIAELAPCSALRLIQNS